MGIKKEKLEEEKDEVSAVAAIEWEVVPSVRPVHFDDTPRDVLGNIIDVNNDPDAKQKLAEAYGETD